MIREEVKPKVRDEFLAGLIREFGAEHGTELYQSRSVTKQELARFIALLKKFKVAATLPYPLQRQQWQQGMSLANGMSPGRPQQFETESK